MIQRLDHLARPTVRNAVHAGDPLSRSIVAMRERRPEPLAHPPTDGRDGKPQPSTRDVTPVQDGQNPALLLAQPVGGAHGTEPASDGAWSGPAGLADAGSGMEADSAVG